MTHNISHQARACTMGWSENAVRKIGSEGGSITSLNHTVIFEEERGCWKSTTANKHIVTILVFSTTKKRDNLVCSNKRSHLRGKTQMTRKQNCGGIDTQYSYHARPGFIENIAGGRYITPVFVSSTIRTAFGLRRKLQRLVSTKSVEVWRSKSNLAVASIPEQCVNFLNFLMERHSLLVAPGLKERNSTSARL